MGKRIELPDECCGLVIVFDTLDGDSDYPFDNDHYPIKYDLRYDMLKEWIDGSPWAKKAVLDFKGIGQCEGCDGVELILDTRLLPHNLTPKTAVGILKTEYHRPLDLTPFEERQREYLREMGEDDTVARAATPPGPPTYGRCLCNGPLKGYKGPPRSVKPEELADRGGNHWQCKACNGWFDSHPEPNSTKQGVGDT